MTLAGLSIRRPVATTMVMIAIVFIGLLAMIGMKREFLPNMDIPVVTVSTTWTGAVAEDVESQITKKIEEALPQVEGIDKISSTSAYGQSTVVVEFDYGVDTDMKVTEIQREVSKIINDLPDDANSPVARKVNVDAGGGTTAVVMFAAPNKNALSTFITEYLKPRLESLTGIGEVNIFGNPIKQVQVHVDSDKLAAYNMTPMELYSLISASSTKVPIGKISDGNKDMVVRFMGEMFSVEEFQDLIINSGGNSLRLSDVADVVLTEEDQTTKAYLDGKESVAIGITKSTDGSTTLLNKLAFEAIEQLEPLMPAGTEKRTLLDNSEFINDSISSVGSNAVQGLILATIVLLLFLKNVRATLLITISLPIAVIFTFAFLSLSGTTLNVISLMGLSIGVGMLTDNSVVVIDNIYRHMTELNSPVREASENGTTEVTMSIIASALTTMVVFIPILFIPGMAREIFRDMSYSIIFSNVAALLVAITLIPMLGSRFLNNKISITKEGKIFGNIKKFYLKIINWAVIHRWKTVLITLGVFVLTIIITPNFVKFQFMPTQDQGQYSVVAELQEGLDLEKADRISKELEEIIKADENTKSYFVVVRANTVAVNVNIGKSSTRSKSVDDIVNEVRPKVQGILDTRISLATQYSFSSPERDVEFIIQGADLNELKNLGKQIYDRMQIYEGAVDITSSVSSGAIELRIELNRDKIRSYGLNPATVAQTLSYYINGGDRGNTTTIKSGTEEIDVLIRLAKEKRSDINVLSKLNIKVGDNQFIKLSDIATIVPAEADTEITKQNRIYSVKVSANDSGVGIQAVQNKFIEEFNNLNTSKAISYTWGGEAENMIKSMSQLSIALGISLFLIYALLASQFESFILSIVIIGSIPLALIGVLWGLVILRQPMDIMVMVGLIMLAGIVVNNAIVLIDFIKTMRERKMKRAEAVVYSCETRLRPILMTTMTTVLGMVPMALGLGEGSEFYKGMATAIMFGLSVSTLLTLVVIPVLYTLTDDFTTWVGKKFSKILGN